MSVENREHVAQFQGMQTLTRMNTINLSDRRGKVTAINPATTTIRLTCVCSSPCSKANHS